jgi:protein-tyrosine-phosphatase
MTELYKILVVCTGNVCRSPMAEGFLRSMASERGLDHVVVESAGIHAPVGSPPSTFAVVAAMEMGSDIQNGRAAYLGRRDVESADLILVMERAHLGHILTTWPSDSGDKVKLLRSYHPDEPKEEDIPDPIGADLTYYRGIADLLHECCTGVMRRLT